MNKLITILKTTSIHGWFDLALCSTFAITSDNFIMKGVFIFLTLISVIKIINNKHYNKSEFNVPKECRKPYVQYEIDCNKLLLFIFLFSTLLIAICDIFAFSRIWVNSFLIVACVIIIARFVQLTNKMYKLK